MEEKRIEQYLNEGENIVWMGKVKENDYLTTRSLNVFPLIVLWLAAEGVILGWAISNRIFGQAFNVYYLVLSIVAIVLHLIPVGIWFFSVSEKNAELNGTEYAVTESRLLILHSSKHDSCESVALGDVLDVRLKRSLAEMIMGTGRIVVETEDEKIVLYSIDKADKIFRKVYRAVLGKGNADE